MSTLWLVVATLIIYGAVPGLLLALLLIGLRELGSRFGRWLRARHGSAKHGPEITAIDTSPFHC